MNQVCLPVTFDSFAGKTITSKHIFLIWKLIFIGTLTSFYTLRKLV